MTPEQPKRCGTCKWWESANCSCHRYPPTIYYGAFDPKTEYPEVGEGDWCGEWTPKEAKP